MSKARLLTTVLASAFLVAFAVPASAVVNPIVDFGTGFAKEFGNAGGARVVDDNTSTAGDNLTIVGFVAEFNDPFNDLDADDPNVEYTYVYRGLVSQGTVVSGTLFTFYDTDYSGGTLEVYCDAAQNADYADMSTFMDGDKILEASLANFRTTTKSSNCAGTQNADLQFTGGSLFDRVSAGGVGFVGIITGLFTVCNENVDDAREAEGYFARSDTKLDVDEPVPAQRRSWGKLKSDLR